MTDYLEPSLATHIQDAVCSCDGVAHLHSGQFGEIALLYPGLRVPGLRLVAGRLEVHVVVKLTAGDLHQLATTIRQAVSELVDLPIDVTIGDVTI